MKREIKFRAWDTDTNQYIGCDLHLIRHLNADYGGLGNRYYYQQYTGLHDKNGKEIYEGDICKFHSFGFDGTEYDINRTGVIKWANILQGFIILESCESIWRITETSHFNEPCLEVIGNIYENPELINQP